MFGRVGLICMFWYGLLFGRVGLVCLLFWFTIYDTAPAMSGLQDTRYSLFGRVCLVKLVWFERNLGRAPARPSRRPL